MSAESGRTGVGSNGEITLGAYTAALEAVVSGNEHHVYESPNGQGCTYRNLDGSPSCLHGHALDRLGVPLDPAWDGDRRTYMARISTVLRRVGIYDRRLLVAAEISQRAQDDGVPWGEVLEEYRRVLAEWNDPDLRGENCRPVGG